MQPMPREQPGYNQYLATQEDNNLKSLAIGALVYGCFQILMVGAQALFMRTWIQLITHPSSFGGNSQDAPQFPQSFLNIMQGFMVVSLVLAAVTGALSIFAAKCIRDRKGWIWTMISASLSCINIPLGTLLAVFMFIVLSKPSVRAKFSS